MGRFDMFLMFPILIQTKIQLCILYILWKLAGLMLQIILDKFLHDICYNKRHRV